MNRSVEEGKEGQDGEGVGRGERRGLCRRRLQLQPMPAGRGLANTRNVHMVVSVNIRPRQSRGERPRKRSRNAAPLSRDARAFLSIAVCSRRVALSHRFDVVSRIARESLVLSVCAGRPTTGINNSRARRRKRRRLNLANKHRRKRLVGVRGARRPCAVRARRDKRAKLSSRAEEFRSFALSTDRTRSAEREYHFG